MRVLGAGLSKTGTTSLARALGRLGYRVLHYDTERLNDVLDGTTADPDFRRYDDVDGVLDLPAAAFYEELLAAYPEAKCILTVRDEDAWWESIRAHFNEREPVTDPRSFKGLLRNHAYGSSTAHEFLYRRRYRRHNERVRRVVPADRLLVMDITGGDGWEELCPFLGTEIPAAPFPHEQRRPDGD